MRFSSLFLALPLLLVACIPTPNSGGSSSSSAPNTYEDASIGYSIDVPAGWSIAADKGIVTDAYQATGTAFVAPREEGSTLSEAYFHVAQVASCPALPGSTSVTIAGTSFQRANWSGAAAGNLYEGVTYAGPKDAGCLLLTGYLHSCNLGSDCGPNHSKPFNKDAYFSTFDAMATSVKFLEHPVD